MAIFGQHSMTAIYYYIKDVWFMLRIEEYVLISTFSSLTVYIMRGGILLANPADK